MELSIRMQIRLLSNQIKKAARELEKMMNKLEKLQAKEKLQLKKAALIKKTKRRHNHKTKIRTKKIQHILFLE